MPTRRQGLNTHTAAQDSETIYTFSSEAALVVTSGKGSTVTARRQDGSLVTRNTSIFHKLPREVAEDYPLIEDEDTQDETEMAVPQKPLSPGGDRERATPPVMAEVPRKTARPRKPTQRLLEQV